jgi:membrane associated rhomboid family serine protease
MTFTVFLLIALVIAHRATTPKEREKFARVLRQVMHDVLRAAGAHYRDVAPLHALLRERTPFAPFTPLVVVINVVMFLVIFVASVLLGDPDALTAWGGNYGPLTANGEWWRLLTAPFLHSNVFHLLVNIIGLLPPAFILERLVGSVGFAVIYLVAGVFSGLFGISAFPMDVSAGASGAVAGVQGLMLATCVWRLNHQSQFAIPAIGFKYLAGSAGVFTAYTLVFGDAGGALVGLLIGLLLGLVVAKGVNEGRTPAMRLAAAVPITIAIAVSTAVPLRGITDARPTLQAILALEEQTSSAFRGPLVEFTAGRMSAAALVQVIERSIIPDLEAARAALEGLDRVPVEQQARVAAAVEYLRLRENSWRVRSQALSKRRMAMLREADAQESASLVAFQRIR